MHQSSCIIYLWIKNELLLLFFFIEKIDNAEMHFFLFITKMEKQGKKNTPWNFLKL